MASSGIVWSGDLLRKVRSLNNTFERRLDALIVHSAGKVQNAAKQGAPWKDQTGNARNGLTGKANVGGSTKEVVLSHGVPYGIWLEVKNGGQYQIIMPTIIREGQVLMRRCNTLLARMT
jgi:hypothetical protein